MKATLGFIHGFTTATSAWTVRCLFPVQKKKKKKKSTQFQILFPQMNRNMDVRNSQYVLNIVFADINNTMLHAYWTLCMCVRLLSRLCVTSLLPKRPLARGSATAGRRCGQRSSGLAASRWLRRWCVMNVLMSSKFPMVKLTQFASGLHSAMNEPIRFQLKRGPIKVLRCCCFPPISVWLIN